MAITGPQHGRHKREWDLACSVQGWNPKDDARRLAFYAANELPASRSSWHPKRDFDRFLEAVKPLQNRVDIADRERDGVQICVDRLNAALLAITGKDYARGIVRDMNDREDPSDLPLDPIAAQVERGDAVADPGKYPTRRGVARRAGYTGARSDLDNLRSTLKNRLSKILSRIKGTGTARTLKAGRIECPPSLAWVLPCANNAAIDAIIDGKIAIRQSDGRAVWYVNVTAAEYARLQRTGEAPAKPLPAPVDEEDRHDAYEPAQPPARRELVPITAANAWSSYVPSEEDDDMPF